MVVKKDHESLTLSIPLHARCNSAVEWVVVVMVTGSLVNEVALIEVGEAVHGCQLSSTQWGGCHSSQEGLVKERERTSQCVRDMIT